jgi:hypothetical protein
MFYDLRVVTGHDQVLDNVIQGVEEAALHDLD